MNGCPSTSSGRTDFIAVIFLQALTLTGAYSSSLPIEHSQTRAIEPIRFIEGYHRARLMIYDFVTQPPPRNHGFKSPMISRNSRGVTILIP